MWFFFKVFISSINLITKHLNETQFAVFGFVITEQWLSCRLNSLEGPLGNNAHLSTHSRWTENKLEQTYQLLGQGFFMFKRYIYNS